MSENYYNILGVSENATKDEIKKAYRSLQMKYHPDKNQSSPESIQMTQKINESYETLGNDSKKQEYDMMRKNPNPFMKMNGQSAGSMQVPMDEIFSMFFGGNGGPFGQQFGGIPGAKIHIFQGDPQMLHQTLQKPLPIMKTVNINMEQVLSGASVPVEIERWVVEGGNKVHEKETIYVDIVQGIDDNELIILRDKGNVLNELIKGDVKIIVKIINNTSFKRSGLDLILEKVITLKEALCGFTFEIKYLNDKSYTLNNNKGNIIPPEYKKIYQNMGLTRGEHKGNMIIHFHIIFPEKLSDDQIEKLIEIL